MCVKEQKPQIPDDLVIREAGEKGYQKGWNDRKEFDSGLVEEALRKSHDFADFSRILRESIGREEGSVE